MMHSDDNLHAMEPTLAETNAKLDTLAANVAKLAAALASGFMGTTQPAQDTSAGAAGRLPFDGFTALVESTDPDVLDERKQRAQAENLDPDAANTLVKWGGRGLYRRRRAICMERSVAFRRYIIMDAQREDVEEAKRMGADLLMDRGGEMPAPPTYPA